MQQAQMQQANTLQARFAGFSARSGRSGFPGRLGLGLFAGLTLSLATGCGGGAAQSQPADSPDESSTGSQRPSGAPLSVSAEIGAMDQDAVQRQFAKSQAALQRCLQRRSEQVEFLGGDVEFSLKVDQSGQAIEAHVSRSTIGDHQTERCQLDALKSQTWPKPQGGRFGTVVSSIGFDMVQDVREPVEWSASQVSGGLGELSDKISECKSSSQGSFDATLYVGTSGEVLSVGLARSSFADEDAAGCLIGVLSQASFDSPGSWPAKVSFSL